MSERRFYGYRYRAWSRLLHRFHLHHAKVLYLDDGTIQDWCQWCGLRSVRVTSLPAYKAMVGGGPTDKPLGRFKAWWDRKFWDFYNADTYGE